MWARAGGHPVFLAALHHTTSPFGPFVEIVTGEFRSRPGLRPRLRQSTLAVSGGPPAPGGTPPARLTRGGHRPRRGGQSERRGPRPPAAGNRVAPPPPPTPPPRPP